MTVYCMLSFAQKNHKIDSLKLFIKTAKDTTLVNSLVSLSDYYLQNSPDSGLYYSSKAMKLAEKTGFKRGLCYSYDDIGVIYAIQANYPIAREYFLKSLKIKQELGDKKGVSGLYLNIAGQQGKYTEALDYNLKSLKIFEEIHFKAGEAMNYSDIGLLYKAMNNDSLALECYFKSLKIHEELDLKGAISSNCNNIGNIYVDQKKYSLALEYFLKALKIKKEIGDRPGEASCYTNIGGVYQKQGDNASALKYFESALKIMKELNDRIGVIENIIGVGEVFVSEKKYTDAVLNFKQAYDLSKEIGLKRQISQACQSLSLVYEKMNDYKKAYEFHTLYSDIKDTLLNQENNKQITEMATKYETDKKELQITSLNKDNEILTKDQKLKETQLNKQLIVNYAILAGLIMVLTLAFFIYRGYKQKQIANMLLEEKNILIEEKNKDITDSINYAKRIQFTLLAQKGILQQNLNEHFVLFQPKDIVSGDFYWAAKKENRFYLAVCDSTGHGVPGAFMSLLNTSFLNEALSEKNIKQPNQILDYVRKRLIENVSTDGAQDGMDGILLCFNDGEITYSASHNSPLIVRDNSIISLPADKMPIGKGEKNIPFTLHSIEYQKGDMLYFYTDGYADQFGGPSGKKFKYKKLEELLVSINSKPLSEQNEILSTTIEKWKGNLEQVYDILVIGVRV